MKHIVLAGAAMLALVATASTASAQCAFEHPKKAGKFTSSFVQAFVSCNNPGGDTPNATTEGGVPTCAPPETFHQQSGSPPGGWTWDEAKGSGSVSFKAIKNKIINPNNPPNDTADVAVQVKVAGVLDEIGPAGPANGVLSLNFRATIRDRAGGDMTIVDFPAGFSLPMFNGKTSIKTSFNVLLNGIGQPGLPKCSSLEIVSATIVDPNGDTFANTGMFLP